MWSRTLCGILLAIAANLPAQAEENFRTFSYTGFYWVEGDTFLPGLAEAGYFRGQDSNHDGVLALDELSEFQLSQIDYLQGFGGYCGQGIYCTLEQFSYTSQGQLDFTTRWHLSDENGTYSEVGMIAGSHFWYNASGAWGSSTSTYRWTDATRFDIMPPPVPEPSSGLMLLLGILGLGALKPVRQGRTRK
jgi:hypothetical protein